MRTLRISSSPDYTVSYIDFIDMRKTQKEYKAPKLPMTLMIAGNGTLATPYNLDFAGDIVAKSLILLKKDHLSEVLPHFFANVNTLLGKLSFFKFTRQTIKDLDDVRELIQYANEHVFYPLSIKCQLFLFENKYAHTTVGGLRQRRRSIPLDNQIFDDQRNLKNLCRFVQLKLFNQKSEIKFGLVFSTTQELQQKTLADKVADSLKNFLRPNSEN